MMATSGFLRSLEVQTTFYLSIAVLWVFGKALNQFLSFKGISAFLVGLNNLTPFISFWGIFASIAWFYMEYWQLEEEGWYLYKMATFPPQHWARVWRPSLRLGGVRLPGMSLHWDPNTCNLALTYSPASSQNSLLFRSSNKYLLQLKNYFGQSGGCLWPWELLLHCPEFQIYTAMNERLCIILTNTEV